MTVMVYIGPKYYLFHNILHCNNESVKDTASFIEMVDLQMSDIRLPAENTPRSPMPAMIALLKDHEPKDVKLLIARMIGTAVYNGDSEEVLYWAVIHHSVVGGDIDPDVRGELLTTLNPPT